MENLERAIKISIQWQSAMNKQELEHAERMGHDAAINGANATNCSFTLFRSKEMTEAWERGNKKGLEQTEK